MSINKIESKLKKFGLKPSEKFLLLCVDKQKLYLIKNRKILKSYPVSTSKFGTGNEKDSYKTPLGTHRIFKKFGDDAPIGAIFEGRKFTGKIARIPSDEDLITTRILWLEGLEWSKNRGGNVDTMERYIYIHGTPEEHKIGIPASKGCIRMKNQDIVSLYNNVEEGTLLHIIPQCLFLAEEEEELLE